MKLTKRQMDIVLGWAYDSLRDRGEWDAEQEELLRALVEAGGDGSGLDSPIMMVSREH